MPRKTSFIAIQCLFLSLLQGPIVFCTDEIILNDVHSRLNATRVDEIHYPESIGEVVAFIRHAKELNKSVSISGGRHAMGGQQFAEGSLHISMNKMDGVLDFDTEQGIIRVEAGIGWPALMDYLAKAQEGQWPQWGIIQKQTGADNLTIGGALSANAHGRGVHFKPIVQDVLGFTLVNADGDVLKVSREENAELFKLAIGGYGLFGVITSVDLKLQPRAKLRRTVELLTLDELPDKARERLEEGFVYGDFQYKTDETAVDFMRVGILSAYAPAGDESPIPNEQNKLSPQNWRELLHLAHADKSKAFAMYAAYYLSTDGQIYWNDTHQMSYYVEDYVEYLDEKMPQLAEGSLMITEVYVPRDKLKEFIEKVIVDVRERDMNVIYGTMRLIERDDETFLAWAKEDYACIIFNLRVEHSAAGLEKARGDFQLLIDRALELGGSYFLTYHRYARKDQVLAAYPQFPAFLALKLKYDPQERFTSEWYRHYKKMFDQVDNDLTD